MKTLLVLCYLFFSSAAAITCLEAEKQVDAGLEFLWALESVDNSEETRKLAYKHYLVLLSVSVLSCTKSNEESK